VDLTAPENEKFTFEQIKAKTDAASEKIRAIPGVKTIGALAGDNSMASLLGLDALGGLRTAGSSTIYVIMDRSTPLKGRNLTREIEDATADVGAQITVQTNSSMTMNTEGLGGSGITVNVYGDDTDSLISSTQKISAALANVKGIKKVDDGIKDLAPELRFTVDREKAMEKGLTVAQVYQQVSAALQTNNEATTVDWKGETFSVKLTHRDENELSPDYIKNLSFFVTKQDGTREKVMLSDITALEEAKTLASIQRDEQRRFIPIAVTLNDGQNITLAADAATLALDKVSLPTGVTWEVTGQNTTIMDSIRNLAFMLLLGIALVYLVMAAQFQSLKSPFIIMFTIPLAFTGGFGALLLTGMELSAVSMIGFVMLVGIIVKNAIVLVDFINRLRLEGKDRVTAIREGGATRMRPILMTALTAILGLLMMGLGRGMGSEMMQPLAIVCIGGLIYATFMTLFVIPIVYDIFSKKELRKVSEEELAADLDA